MSTIISNELGQYIKQIIESLKANRCAILVGAGFSKNADSGSLYAPTFPTWNELADTFYEKLYSDVPEGVKYLNPLIMAEQVEATYGRSVLNQMLSSRIPDTQYSPSTLHMKLLKLPWTDIFTTNYDTLLERASQEITDKRYNIINCKEDLVSSSDAPRIIKLHGTFPSHRPFIITSEDYRKYPREFAPFINTVQQSLLENTLCLIGFSGDDPNFNQWVGWIHDNLGIENSPQIYLFTHEDYSHAQTKLLERKKVIVLNIDSLAPSEGPRKKYESLLDYLLENTRISHQNWPDILNFGEPRIPLTDVISKLKQSRELYPGWLTAPYDVRKKAIHIRRQIGRLLEVLLKDQQDMELFLLYEYDWLKEKCLHPITDFEHEVYLNIIERNLGQTIEEQKIRVSIKISLLRYYREKGEFEKWTLLYKQIKTKSPLMDEQQLNRIHYENCLFSMFNFDYKELKINLEEWVVNEHFPEWVLRKSGLLAECNDLKKAQEILQNSLVIVRRELQNDNQNLLLLSYESAMMSLKGYIEQALSFQEDYGKTWSERIDTEVERRQLHKKHTVDWNSQDQHFQLIMNVPPQNNITRREQPTFDFGIRTTYSNFISEDTDSVDAYAFLRFREDTGHPFRIFNVTSGNKAAVGAIKRIAHKSFSWAVVTTARTNEDKAVEDILPRSTLNIMTASTANDLSYKYLGILRNILEEIEITVVSKSNSFANFTAGVLPLLLSHLCTKCTLNVLDDMLQLLLEIYQNDNRLHFKKVNKWAKRLMNVYSKEEILNRLPLLLEFPVLSEIDQKLNDFIDPVYLITLPVQKPKNVIDALEGSEDVFINATTSSESCLRELGRLVILSCNGWLTVEQDKRLGDLLWKDNNFIIPADFNSTISLFLPHPNDISPKEFISKSILSRLQEQIKESKTSISSNDTLMDELLFAVDHEVFVTNDMSNILPIIEEKQSHYLYFYDRANLIDVDSIARKEMLKLTKVLSKLLIDLSEWSPSNTEEILIEKILGTLQNKQDTHPILEILWAKKRGEAIDVRKVFLNHLFLGDTYQKNALFDAAILLAQYSDRGIITQEELQQLYTLIAQQILWRNNNHLVSALNVMTTVIIKNPEIISLEIENSLLIGLECLKEESKWTSIDGLDKAVPKGEIRVATARLAKQMNKYFDDKGNEIPKILSDWEVIYKCPDEFSEIRNVNNQ